MGPCNAGAGHHHGPGAGRSPHSRYQAGCVRRPFFSGWCSASSVFSIDDKVLAFLRDFALIIFVYALGLQVGPGFLTSIREEGLRLNVLAIAAVALGGVFTWMIAKWGHPAIDIHAASGLYAGAFTTTPGLAAGQDALKHMSSTTPSDLAKAGLAYTVTYPFGIVGPIISAVAILLLRRMFRVNIADERAKLTAADEIKRPPIAAVSFELTRDDLVGVVLRELEDLRNTGVIFSRLLRAGALSTPTGETALQLGDIYRAVGPRTAVEVPGQEPRQSHQRRPRSQRGRLHPRRSRRHTNPGKRAKPCAS